MLLSSYWGSICQSHHKKEELNERLCEALEMEDPDLMVDLRELNKGRIDKFTVFWEKMKVYLNESSAVDERRHGEITYGVLVNLYRLSRGCVSSSATEIIVLRQHHNTACTLRPNDGAETSAQTPPCWCPLNVVHYFGISVLEFAVCSGFSYFC